MRYQRMYRVSKTPDKDEWRWHESLGSLVNSFVESHVFDTWDGHNTWWIFKLNKVSWWYSQNKYLNYQAFGVCYERKTKLIWIDLPLINGCHCISEMVLLLLNRKSVNDWYSYKLSFMRFVIRFVKDFSVPLICYQIYQRF